MQEFQSSALREYFKEDALLFPVETIIGNHTSLLTLNREDIAEGFRILPQAGQLPEGCGYSGEIRKWSPRQGLSPCEGVRTVQETTLRHVRSPEPLSQ